MPIFNKIPMIKALIKRKIVCLAIAPPDKPRKIYLVQAQIVIPNQAKFQCELSTDKLEKVRF
jgi:hypothetical protein